MQNGLIDNISICKLEFLERKEVQKKNQQIVGNKNNGNENNN